MGFREFGQGGEKTMNKYFYFISYVGKGSIFGMTTIDTSKRINPKNCADTLKEVAKKIGDDTGMKEVIIINFKELEDNGARI